MGAVDQRPTAAERSRPLAGDEVVPDPDVSITRAIAIDAPPEGVWPWIAQLGQGQGGFYSYDWLENLLGCRIHSADRIVPGWQAVEVGGQVRLHPDVALDVAAVDAGRHLVLHGAVPVGGGPAPYDFSWAFVVDGTGDGSTRLLVRERYGYVRWWAAAVVRPATLASAVMSRRMLRGIRDRAESV